MSNTVANEGRIFVACASWKMYSTWDYSTGAGLTGNSYISFGFVLNKNF